MDSVIKKIIDFRQEDIAEYGKYLMLGGGTPGPNLVKGQGYMSTIWKAGNI